MPTYAKPTLVLDERRARRNIERMTEKAARLGLRFRPHFKTHQSRRIGRFFRELGVGAITVSSVDMAAYFAADGWRDILIAFPVNILEMTDIRRLSARVPSGVARRSGGRVGRLGRRDRGPGRDLDQDQHRREPDRSGLERPGRHGPDLRGGVPAAEAAVSAAC